jgi:hypothetical protein
MPEFGREHRKDERRQQEEERRHSEERRHRQEDLDEAGEESFPASDPPAVGRPDPPPLPGPHR